MTRRLFLIYLFLFLHDSQLFIFTNSCICTGFTFYFSVVIRGVFFFFTEVKVQILSEYFTQLKIQVSGQKHTWVKVKSTTLKCTQVFTKSRSTFIFWQTFRSLVKGRKRNKIKWHRSNTYSAKTTIKMQHSRTQGKNTGKGIKMKPHLSTLVPSHLTFYQINTH